MISSGLTAEHFDATSVDPSNLYEHREVIRSCVLVFF